jgi:site-specific DNA-methyltransferase (adenine-specific)
MAHFGKVQSCYLDEKFVDVIVNRYVEQAGSAENVVVIRNGQKIKYEELKREGGADEAVDLP